MSPKASGLMAFRVLTTESFLSFLFTAIRKTFSSLRDVYRTFEAMVRKSAPWNNQ
jgi:hypothetical protein